MSTLRNRSILSQCSSFRPHSSSCYLVFGLSSTSEPLALLVSLWAPLLPTLSGLYEELPLNLCKTCYLGLLVYLISRIIILCGAVTAGKDIMLFFASVSVVLTSATILCAIICIKNFDRGFKAINQSKNGHAQESYSIPARNSPAEPSRPPSRLTLD